MYTFSGDLPFVSHSLITEVDLDIRVILGPRLHLVPVVDL